MSEFERELVKIIKFKNTDYADRQDYLAALARAADKWFAAKDKDQKIFDNLDDGLQGWFEEAITAMNTRPPAAIPDFPDRELEEPEPESDEEVEDENNDDAQPDAGVDDTGNAPVTAEPQVGTVEAEPDPNVGDGKKAKKAKKAKSDKKTTRYDNIDGSKDRYGITIGTKTAEAVKLYEKGTTAKEIDEKIGGRHYNVLVRLAREGHRVEKQPGGGFKLTHKDDLKKE